MTLLESLKIPLGTKMSTFELKSPLGKIYKSNDLIGEKGLLLVFTCNHCPYAQAVWPRLIRLADEAKTLEVGVVAINPNIHPNYPEDSPSKMIELIKMLNVTFPYLVDDTQDVARAFRAQCTPDIFLFNDKKELVYHGRIDDNWKDEKAVTRQELKTAINQLASSRPIDKNQMPAMGCSIKWRI